MKKLCLFILVFLFIGCGPGVSPITESEMLFDSFYWDKLVNDDPSFVRKITIPITFYVCGNSETLKSEFLQTHLEYADFFEGQTIIGYAYPGEITDEVWIIGKTNKDGIYVPPIILAHEILEILSMEDSEMVSPHDYGKLVIY